MLKRLSSILFLCFTIILLISCSKQASNDPTDDINEYINAWQSNAFDKMYAFLNEETQDNHSLDDFTNRYEKIVSDLQLENLEITFDALSKEDRKEFIKEEEATIPIEVTMDSIAGEINFTHELHATLDTIDSKEKEWLFHWDSTYIFPELEDDAKIRVEKLKPRRGDILDRNRMPLAINDGAYEVGMVLDDIQNKDSEIANVASILDMSTSSIEEKLDATWVEAEHFVPLRIISTMDEKKINELRFIPGVSLKETSGRHYPLENVAAHLIGYISKVNNDDLEKEENSHLSEEDMIGKSGLEQLYEDELRGEEGIKIIVTNEFGVENVIAEKSVKHGETIHLTIDINMQKKLFESYEEHSGTSVALDPKTGELLALVSYPAFNPNDFTYGISQTKWDQLSDDKMLPLFNRFTATFAPGSVFKPITAAIGLEDGSLTHEEELTINGLTWKKDSWSNARITRVSATGLPVDLQDALERSDNIFFAQKSLDIGDKAFEKGLHDFGFNEKIPTDFSVKQSQISNDDHLKDEILLANTSYGQGEIEVSPIHLALMYTTFINKGSMVQPQLTMNNKVKMWKKGILNEKDANKISGYLRDVVTSGTAKIANDKKVAISGKTGTVELKLAYEEDGAQNGWFVGYATDDEDILIATLVEDVGGAGSSAAAEIVKDAIISYKK